MFTFLTSTWGIWLVGFACGAVLGHGTGYDSCFKDKVETQAEVDNIFAFARGDITKGEYEKRMKVIKKGRKAI